MSCFIFLILVLALGFCLQLFQAKSHFFATVTKLWPKKNAVGKEQVAQFVDDIYRFLSLFVLFFFLG